MRTILLGILVISAVALQACGGERSSDSRSARRPRQATGEASAPAPVAGRDPASRTADESPAAATFIDPASIATGPKRVNRLLIFGLDGATWRLMTPLMKSGKMPNMARLAKAGIRAELTTLEPTVSPAIWTTIATGVLPDRHGILGFEGVPGMTMTTLPNTRMRRVKAYWNILSDFRRTTGTFGWWVTWPAENVGEGSFIVSDRVPYTRMEAAVRQATLSGEDTFPPDLLDELSALVLRPNDIDPGAVARFLKMSKPQMQESLIKGEYKMGDYLSEFKFVYQSDLSTLRMALHVLKEHAVDVAAVYLTGIDTVSHLYWHWCFPEEFPKLEIPPDEIERYRDVIPQYYVLMDEYLGQLLAVTGPETTVMVVSDHGFGGTGRVPWSGGHGSITPGAPSAPPGVLLLSGPGIATSGKLISGAHVLDIAPTILYLMGVPAAKEMTGRVLMEAMAPGSPAELPRVESFEVVGAPRTNEAIPEDPAGDAERIERLRALGYIQ